MLKHIIKNKFFYLKKDIIANASNECKSYVDEDANMSGSDGSQGSEVSPAQTSAFMQLIRQSFPGRLLAPWAGVSKWGAESGPSDSPDGNGAEAAGDGPDSPEGSGAPDVGDEPGSPEYDPFEEDDD